MDFISAYIREQKRYTKNELLTMFRFNDEEIERFLRELKSFGILKAVKNDPKQKDLTELNDEDIEITDDTLANDELYYVFTFVGVLTFGNRILKCYPKYITTTQPFDEIKLILKVLNKYSSNEQIIKMFNNNDKQSSFNLLAVILFLMQDYYENGIYSNSEDIVEINGEGNILWNQTISDGFAIINENKPYYVELYTQYSVDDEYDYFTRLHKAVISECSKQLEAAGLLGLFEFDSIELSEETIADFGEVEYVLYRLQSELNIQFNTHRQLLLKSLYAYISQQKTLSDQNCISLFGTTNFNLVWEKVCAEVFDNKLQFALGKLKLPIALNEKFNPNYKLIDIIENPQWVGKRDSGTYFVKYAKDTLVPDLISLNCDENDSVFAIYDAKYYFIQLEEDKPLRGQPGVGDITKQYLYQLAYKDFIAKHNIKKVKNCFLMPTDKNKVVNLGYAKFEMLEALGLENIAIRLLPAMEIYHYYLNNIKKTFKYLSL